MASRTGVILAAGHGTRMKSDIPKPLVSFAGKPMIQWVYDTLSSVCEQILVVVQQQNVEQFKQVIPNATFIIQKEQLGTADALKQSLDRTQFDDMLVICADSPCVSKAMLTMLIDTEGLGVLAFHTDDPKSYGRVLDDKIVESHKQKIVPQKAPCNSGIYRLSRTFLNKFYQTLTLDESGEYLLTDWVEFASKESQKVNTIIVPEWRCTGVNTMRQKVELERRYDLERVLDLMDQGVEVHRPESIIIRGQLTVGKGVVIEPGCYFEGAVTLSNGVVLAQGCQIKNSAIGSNAHIKAYTIISDSKIANDVTLGPYAHIQQSQVGDHAYLGNYMECKRTIVGQHVKAKHMSYLGDGRVEQHVNIGAGTVFCNYDGVKKSITQVGEYSFIGANTSLIAPVCIGNSVMIGAGSVVTNDVASNLLFVMRPREAYIRSRQTENSV